LNGHLWYNHYAALVKYTFSQQFWNVVYISPLNPLFTCIHLHNQMLRPQYFICEDLFSDLATYLHMIHYFGQSLNGLLDMHNTGGTPYSKTILSNVWFHSYKCVLSQASCHKDVNEYTYRSTNLTASPWMVTENCLLPILAPLHMPLSSNTSSLTK
jgi:hypothetical protein